MRPAGFSGRIITFYSYKGGTGRTMALANIACLLAQDSNGKGVLMIDWDLEAPGLHRYFAGLVSGHFPGDRRGKQFDAWPGLVDLVVEIRGLMGCGPEPGTEESARAVVAKIQLDRFVIKTDIPSLYFLKAGSFDDRYATQVNTLDWESLHARSPWLFRAFAEYLAARFQSVLIDARTGVTDSGGICTSIMPDTLVVVFTPNRQSLLGGLDVARHAARYRKDSDDLRPLRILPLVSRVEAAEPVLRDAWRFGDLEKGVLGYQPAFEMLFNAVYDLPSCDLSGYFSEIQAQHVPRFAYGEEIAARVESRDRLSLTRSFECFLKRMLSAGAPWEPLEVRVGSEELEQEAPLRDEAWIEDKRASALVALGKLQNAGFMQASFFLSTPPGPISQRQLFQAAQAAQVPGTGWAIGAVVAASTSHRPRPAENGLYAEIIDESTKSYDYWELRTDGSFYFIRGLEEEAEYLLADDRVERSTELLLYCKRLYSFLGLGDSTRVRISVSYGGLRGRALGCRREDTPDVLLRLTGSCTGDRAESEIVVPLGRIQAEIVRLVQDLTRPLFLLFDFYELPESEYTRLIGGRLENWGFARRSVAG